MRIPNHYALGAAALGLLLGGVPLAAQDEGPQSEPANQAPAPAETRSESGNLAWVNLDDKTLAITTADGRELQFQFNDATKVSGGDEGVAGLAARTGTPVTVEYEAKDGVAMATSIAQQEKADAPAPEADQPQPEQ